MRDDEIEDGLSAATEVTVEFTRHMDRLRDAMAGAGADAEGLSRGLSSSLKSAFEGVILDGDKVSDALRGVGRSLVDKAFTAAVKPVSQGLGGLVGGLLGDASPFADGGAFVQGRVTPFAQGGVVSAPTTFPMRGGTGLMGEAGPEAIMPLARGPDGRLGVRSEGGSGAAVTINISTPDVEGFRRSRSQIAAEMSRALGRGSRNR